MKHLALALLLTLSFPVGVLALTQEPSRADQSAGLGAANVWRGGMSGPDERWILAFEPLPAGAARVAAAGAFRHDAFEAQLAGLLEDERALGLDCVAEQDAVGPSRRPTTTGAALKRASALKTGSTRPFST
jgi:hypothetical protein